MVAGVRRSLALDWRTMSRSRREFLSLGGAAMTAAAMGRPAAANGDQSAERPSDGANWGRWGADDQKGAVNLITPAKRLEAISLVKSGRAVSLSRTFTPPQHYLRINERGAKHSVTDYLGFEHHGINVTHVDALCHMWDRQSMWNGRDP
jgi:hypothetical protein